MSHEYTLRILNNLTALEKEQSQEQCNRITPEHELRTDESKKRKVMAQTISEMHKNHWLLNKIKEIQKDKQEGLEAI